MSGSLVKFPSGWYEVLQGLSGHPGIFTVTLLTEQGEDANKADVGHRLASCESPSEKEFSFLASAKALQSKYTAGRQGMTLSPSMFVALMNSLTTNGATATGCL